MGTALNNYTSPQPGLLNSPITNIQSNAKGRASQMLAPTVILGQTQGQPSINNPILTAFGLTSSTPVNPNQIVNLTADPSQSLVIVLADGSTVSMSLSYFAGQEGWFYSISYNNATFVRNNRRLVASPNMLDQWNQIIPFGLALTTSDGYEPIFLTDFVTGRAKLYILESTHVVAIAEAILNAS